MRGRHKHKWDSLRQVLNEKIVYDDNNIRVWMSPDGSGQGLLYYAKQAQVGLQADTGDINTHHRALDAVFVCCFQ